MDLFCRMQMTHVPRDIVLRRFKHVNIVLDGESFNTLMHPRCLAATSWTHTALAACIR